MIDPFWATLIVAVVTPILTAWLMNWGKSRDREEDRKDRAAAALLLAQVSSKVGEVNSKVDGMLADRDKANKLEGKREGVAAGEEKAAVLAEGQRQGVEIARASANATNMGTTLSPGAAPVPVADDRVAVATERMADAAEENVKKP